MARRVFLHPNAPERLKRLYRALRSMHKIAAQLGVNVSYVHDLLRHGIEPTNPRIRTKIFLDVHPLSKMQLGDRRSAHLRWFMRMTPAQRNQWILFCYHYKDKDHEH